MKNLKKVLALVLVVATLMGFATVSSAKFSDDSSIQYKEAVEVMSMINVINGYTDGTFRPTANVTRAQMAKMIAYIVAGGEDVGNLYAGANTFTDCANHWAKGYIAYANKTGIVAGVGNGKFNPDGNVTGVQVAKMLLCALEYDATIETYTGANWAVNVMADAKSAGLLKGLPNSLDYSQPMTREAAAQMMFNALKADVVEYENPGSTIIVEGIEIVQGASKAKAVENTSSDYTNKGKAPGTNDNKTLQLCEKYFEDLYYSEAGRDSFQRPSVKWTYNKDSVIAAKTAELTYTDAVKGEDLNDDLDDADIGIADDGFKVYRNGGSSNTWSKETIDAFLTGANKGDSEGGPGTLIEIYTKDDEDGNTVVSDVIVVATYLAKVNKVTADKASTKDDESALDLTVYMASNKNMTVKIDDEAEGFDEVYAKAEKGDYLLVTPKGDNSASSTVVSMAVPEVVSGTLTAKGSDYYKVGDTKYTLADTFESRISDATFDNTCDFFLDTYGNVIGAIETEAGDEVLNYLFLDSKKVSLPDEDGFDSAEVQIKVTYLDGKKATLNYELEESNGNVKAHDDSTIADGDKYFVGPDGKNYPVADSGDDDDAKTVLASGFYSYKMSDDEVTLKALVSSGDSKKADASQTVYFKEGEARVRVSDGGAVKGVANSNTVLSVVKDGKVSTYTGYSNFPTQSFTDVDVLYVYKTGTNTLANVYVLGGSVSEEVTYAVYTGKGDETSDGQFENFFVDGEEQSYIMKGGSAVLTEGNIYTLDVDGEEAKATAADMESKQTVTEVGENYFVYNNGSDQFVYLADDAEIYDITDLDAITSASINEDDAVIFALNDDDEAEVVYIVKA